MDARQDERHRARAFRLDVLSTKHSGGLPAPWRVPLLMLGFIALFVGTGAGLARLGWAMPALAVSAVPLHGPLMIGAFFGSVISLERAVAIGRGPCRGTAETASAGMGQPSRARPAPVPTNRATKPSISSGTRHGAGRPPLPALLKTSSRNARARCRSSCRASTADPRPDPL